MGDSQSGPQAGAVDDEQAKSFWWGRCGARGKRLLLVVLVTCYVGQTYLVYSDPPPKTPPLNERALEGRKIWHEKNCQACHQLYGMGGFLGPDLTNATERVSGYRLRDVLTKGSGAMPAYNLERKQIAAVGAFLAAMNQTGRGQARRYTGWDAVDPDVQTAQAVAKAAAADPRAAEGLAAFESRCMICHAHLRDGNTGAPDLSTVFARNSAEDVHKVLLEGRPPKMPSPGLTPDEQALLFDYLRWLESRRDDLVEAAGTGQERQGFFSSLPWWEFR